MFVFEELWLHFKQELFTNNNEWFSFRRNGFVKNK